MYFKGVNVEDVEWTQVAVDRAQWRSLVNTFMKFRLYKGRGIC
jgi:hypothetical protein